MMVLGPVESNPVVLIRLAKAVSGDFVTALKERLNSTAVRVITVDETPEGTVLGITTCQEELEIQAEHVKLVKKNTQNGIQSEFTVENKHHFVNPTNNSDYYDKDGLFSTADRVRLVFSMLHSINVLPSGSISTNLSRQLDQLNIPYRRKVKEDQTTTDNVDDKSFPLLHVLESHELTDAITAVHISHLKNNLFQQVKNWGSRAPLQDIRDYYGEEVAFYFSWMKFFVDYLLFPGVVAAIVRIIRHYRDDTIDTCEITPFLGIFVFLWGILFLRQWERQEARTAYSWGTFSSTGYQTRNFGKRSAFTGELRISEVTGLEELYYPSYKRQLKYLGSAAITLVLLAGAFSVMVLSLNLQGYVHQHSEEEYHPFYYPWLSAMSEEGHFMDAQSFWRCYIPVVLHVSVVTAMNMTYRHIAERLTEWENHETDISHANSLLVKRFLFEAFDAYIILFYLAFYDRDIIKLRGELVSLFVVDTFRRVGTESILPLILQRGSGATDAITSNTKKTDAITKDETEPTPNYLEDLAKDDYEGFDDYLEIILQFGYVTLFASAYPFAAFVAMFANIVELKSDLFKMTNVCRRPCPNRTDSIGTWKILLQAIIWLSALTNCIIFAFTSKQMSQFFPGYFTVNEENVPVPVKGKGWIVVFIVFGIERVLIYSGILINVALPAVPEDVTNEVERKHYIEQEEFKALQRSRQAQNKSQSK